MNNGIKGSKGYTLFEITITCVLVSVLAGMALPSYRAFGERSRSSEGVQILSAINEAQNLHVLENFVEAGSLANLSALEIPATISSFNAPVLYTNFGQRAYINRSNGDYRLYVDAIGNISCDDTPGWGGICAKMGLALYPF